MQIFEAHFGNKFALAGMFGSSLVSIKTVGTLDSSSQGQKIFQILLHQDVKDCDLEHI